MFDGFDDVQVAVFHFGGRHIQVARDKEDIDLDGIGARLLHLPGIIDPAFVGDTIEAGDDRDLYPLLHVADILQVFVDADVVFIQPGK